MKCIVDIDIKDCCNQHLCCSECGYEDCNEGCSICEDVDDCLKCEYAVRTVLDEIKNYGLNEMAIYLHSLQYENYSVEEIKELLNKDMEDFNDRN